MEVKCGMLHIPRNMEKQVKVFRFVKHEKLNYRAYY